MLYLKTKARISGRTWQAVINITKLGRTGVNEISLHFRLVNLKGRNCCRGKGKSLDCALDYPDKLITVNSFPWLPYNAHKRCSTNKKRHNNNLTIYYRTKYNKHTRTDKVVRHILHKYHNMHIPKLTKAYCNTI